MSEIQYRFPKWKDASWNSFERQLARYRAIAPFLGSNQIGAEIGVYKGGFGEFLLPHCEKLFLVDPWYRANPWWASGLPNDSRVETVINILQTYKEDIQNGRVEVVVDYSDNFLQSVANGFFDFVYIDASHRYEDTLIELRLAYPKIKKGGFLFGDDYDPDMASRQHGVYRAVNEFAAVNKLALVLNQTRQWGLRV